jgi:uncharacterized zinc-type alcohol dehydrogenase-like protein
MFLCGLLYLNNQIGNEWGTSDYPLVLGHEGIGVVRKVGSLVESIQVGDTVGVAWIRDSCKACDSCMCGRENICERGYQGTYLGPSAGCWGKEPHHAHGGCFSKVTRVEQRFVVPIPDNVPSTYAAPLLCAGATVFEPVVDYVMPGTKVAVASIGGLGTKAIQFASAYGGHVTALSRSENKRDKCLAMGASDFYACLGKKEKMKELAGRFDVIIDASPANVDVGLYLDMLKFNGVYCRVGIPDKMDQSFKYDYIPLIFSQKKIAGSVVTGTYRMKRMFELVSGQPGKFLSDPDSWKIKKVPFDQVNKVMNELLDGKNTENYRYVLEW